MRGFQAWPTALAALALVAAPAIARVQNDGPGMIAAGEQLQARLKTATRGTAPSLAGKDAALVRTAFDAAAIRAHPLTLDIGNVCVAVGNAIVAYTEYTARVTAGESNPAAASDALLMKSYQDEMALGAVAANVCVQRGFRAVGAFVTGLSEDRRAATIGPLREMRDGAVMTIEGTLQSAFLPGMKPANAAAMLASILEDAPALAASLTLAERTRIRKAALDRLAGATLALAKPLNAIAQAYAGSQCDILCKTAGG